LDCVTVVRQLWDYLDGEGDSAAWEAIKLHLATCTGCQSHVDFCRGFLAQVAAVPVDPGMVAAMRVRIERALGAAGAS
jgi:anti-sigma factor RsiW